MCTPLNTMNEQHSNHSINKHDIDQTKVDAKAAKYAFDSNYIKLKSLNIHIAHAFAEPKAKACESGQLGYKMMKLNPYRLVKLLFVFFYLERLMSKHYRCMSY